MTSNSFMENRAIELNTVQDCAANLFIIARYIYDIDFNGPVSGTAEVLMQWQRIVFNRYKNLGGAAESLAELLHWRNNNYLEWEQ
jgi:hypothetical protein